MATEALQQAQAEKLTLLVAESKTGYFSVYLSNPGQPKPYQAQVRRGGNKVHLGCFATAEEAALQVARSPEGGAGGGGGAGCSGGAGDERGGAAAQAQAEKLTLLVAENSSGYFGVYLAYPGRPKSYKAQVRRGGNTVHLGMFTTAEEAALCVARSPEGQAAAAERAAAAAPVTSEQGRQQAQAEKLTLLVAENSTGYVGVYVDRRSLSTSPIRRR
jgi:hypothetical protein